MPDSSNPLLANLTEPQRQAVCHVDGPLLILAGPGSGKTRVVTHRIAWMLKQGVSPRKILALTFTNKAAEEMRSRVERLVPGQSVWVSTFHRLCARLLRQYAALVGLQDNYTIYDTDDSLRALRTTMNRSKFPAEAVTPDSVARAISWAKNSLIGPAEYTPRQGNLVGAVVAHVYPAYQQQLLSSNAVDFDDLLMHVATLLRENAEIRAALDERFRYIMVDEYQDTNLAQYAIARGLSIDHPNLAVTGDPDQSIYGWRGANLNNILDFERDFPEVCVVRLERNYRSTQRILRVADELIRHNVRRKEKRLFTENGVGVPVRLVVYQTEQDEARDLVMQIAAGMERGRRPRDFAVFYRVNALSRVFELALREAGIPYQLVQGVQFFQREEIKDMVAYLKAVNNPRDQVAVERIVNTPARGIGKTTFARVAEYAQRRGIAWLEAALHVGEIAAVQKRSAKPVADFARLMRRFGELATGPVEKLLGCVLNDTGYRQRLEAGDERDQERLSNCEELLGVARQFDERYGGQGSLDAFLEDICLVSDTDAWEDTADRVTLMTLHAAKGLEFPCVFLVAVEENLLPHERSKQNEQSLEEERRLMFVGITRAQEELQISRARYRDYRGVRKLTIPSSFLMQLPRDEMELDDRSGGAYGLAPGSSFGASRGALAGPGLGARAAGGQGSGHYHFCDDDGWGAPPENEPVFSRPMPAEEAFVGPEDGATEQPANGLSGSSGRKSAPGLPSGTEEGPEDELGTVPIFEVPRRSRGSRKWDCPLQMPDKSEEKPADETSEVSRPRSRPRRSRSAGSYRLMTAAEMAAALGDDSDAAADAANRARSAAEAATGATEPDAFAQGSIVRHAEFGLGRVVALSGAGKKRRAVVDFASTAGRQEIALADGSLRAVK